MFEETENRRRKIREGSIGVASNVGQSMYARKFSSDFSKEMTRSVRRILQEWISE
jgi:FMN reductase (NADPH)